MFLMIVPPATTSGSSLFLIEAGLTLIAVALAFAIPSGGRALFAPIERVFSHLARQKGLAVLVVGFSDIFLRLAILPLFPIPHPIVTDDFSFLLAADTFASGRLTNPTPVMWQNFESIHIDMLPTYMSMYFPGQGLMLAAGKVVLGNPWWGVLIVTALMCSAICWMLQAWMPPTWALLGGFIAVLHIGLFSYWVNTYHAGSIMAFGGALILGAFPRFKRHLYWRDSFLLGLGIVLLVLSRPYEGLLLCLPVGFVLVRWTFFSKDRPALGKLLRRSAVPLALVTAAVAWMGYYDYRVFGNPLTPPYSINRATYASAPYYIWQSARPEPAYRHQVMRKFYEDDELHIFEKIHSPAGFLPQTILKGFCGLLFFAGFLLLPPLVMVHRVFRDRRIRFLVVVVLVTTAGLLIEIFLIPHYLAAITAAFYAIGLQAMRHLRFWKPGNQPVGQGIVRLIVLFLIFTCGIRLFSGPLHLTATHWPSADWNVIWYGPGNYGQPRADIQSRLEALPNKQLVIVRYSQDHVPYVEWVYNAPDIDSAKVVWAREMDVANNTMLIQYYKDRKVWLVQPDLNPEELQPYPGLKQPSP